MNIIMKSYYRKIISLYIFYFGFYRMYLDAMNISQKNMSNQQQLFYLYEHAITDAQIIRFIMYIPPILLQYNLNRVQKRMMAMTMTCRPAKLALLVSEMSQFMQAMHQQKRLNETNQKHAIIELRNSFLYQSYLRLQYLSNRQIIKEIIDQIIAKVKMKDRVEPALRIIFASMLYNAYGIYELADISIAL